MLTMDQIHHIRALYYEQGYNIAEIAEATGRDWKTVAKYIAIAHFNDFPQYKLLISSGPSFGNLK